MKHLKRILLSSAAVLMLAPVAQAEGVNVYLSGFAGINLANDVDLGADTGAPITVLLEQDNGYNIGGAIGAEFENLALGPFVPRAELELSYRTAGVDQIFFSGNGPGAEINVSGDVDTLNLGLNAYLDLTTFGAFRPFIGVGVGGSRVDINAVYGPGVRINTSDTSLSVQGIIGAGYEINEFVTATIDARYYTIFDAAGQRIAPTGVVTNNVSDNLSGWTVNLGARINIY